MIAEAPGDPYDGLFQWEVRTERPTPHTSQYAHRVKIEHLAPPQPRSSTDCCGWVVAVNDPMYPYASNSFDAAKMNMDNSDFLWAFQCISGWVLMVWRNEEEFEAGIAGDRGAPRPIAWFDLRKAYDVRVDMSSPENYDVPHRITVSMVGGNKYFCVRRQEEVMLWRNAITRTIQDASMQRVRSLDAANHQSKRWPAACGIAGVMVCGGPIGDRAAAILFQCYDLDYDGCLGVGEVVLLIHELLAGLLHADGRAEGQDRDTAVKSISNRISEEQIFDRAVQFCRQCSRLGDGRVKKEDFLKSGRSALREAIDLGQ